MGQENRLDVTNPHTERFFKNLKNRPAVGVWYRLDETLTRKYLNLEMRFQIVFNTGESMEGADSNYVNFICM